MFSWMNLVRIVLHNPRVPPPMQIIGSEGAASCAALDINFFAFSKRPVICH